MENWSFFLSSLHPIVLQEDYTSDYLTADRCVGYNRKLIGIWRCKLLNSFTLVTDFRFCIFRLSISFRVSLNYTHMTNNVYFGSCKTLYIITRHTYLCIHFVVCSPVSVHKSLILKKICYGLHGKFWNLTLNMT